MSGRRRNRKKKANAASVTALGKGSENITGDDQELIAYAAVEKIQVSEPPFLITFNIHRI